MKLQPLHTSHPAPDERQPPPERGPKRPGERKFNLSKCRFALLVLGGFIPLDIAKWYVSRWVVMAIFRWRSVDPDIADKLHSVIGLNAGIAASIEALIVFAAVSTFALGFRGKSPFSILRLDTKVKGRAVVVCFLVLLVLKVGELIWRVSFGVPISPTSPSRVAYHTATSTAFFFLATGLIGPFNEEVLFRGILFESLDGFGEIGAVGTSALFWALFHPWSSVMRFFVLLIHGVLLGLARSKTKSLSIPLFLHSAYNIITFIELLVSQ